MKPGAKLLFVMTGSCGVTGGIATANHNVLTALVDLTRDGRRSLAVWSFLEVDTDRPPFLPAQCAFRGFRRQKARLAAALLDFVLRAAISRQRPILCFDHVTLALPVLPLAAVRLVRTVIFAHGSEAWKRVRRTSRWSFRFAARCLTNSNYTLDRMRHHVGRFQGVACPLGLSPALPLNNDIAADRTGEMMFQAADGTPRPLGDRVLLLVGRLDPAEREKGHRQLLEVLPALLQRYSDVQLVCAGPGSDRDDLAERARRAGVAHAVFLPGRVTTDVLKGLYQCCYALVMPSRQEGFGLVYLEAMNFGKPCVGCFDDGAEEVIANGDTGLLVRNPDDRRELLDVLCRLLADPQYARTLGRNGFRRLHAHFTAHHYQERLKLALAPLLVKDEDGAAEIVACER